MMKFTIEAPWFTFQKKLAALFEQDPDIYVGELGEIVDDAEGGYWLPIEVENHEKFLAMQRLMPAVKEFGSIKVCITIYDEENENCESDIASAFETLFKGNPIVKDVKSLVDQAGTKHNYLRFSPEVVQFFDDDLSDYNGNWNGLAEDIAREVFNVNSMDISFCTAPVEEK